MATLSTRDQPAVERLVNLILCVANHLEAPRLKVLRSSCTSTAATADRTLNR